MSELQYLMETKMWRKWFNMVLRFSKALSPHSLELITQANVIIKKLNGIVSDIQSTQNLEAENHRYHSPDPASAGR